MAERRIRSLTAQVYPSVDYRLRLEAARMGWTPSKLVNEVLYLRSTARSGRKRFFKTISPSAETAAPPLKGKKERGYSI